MKTLLAGCSDEELARSLHETLAGFFPDKGIVIEGKNVGHESEEDPALKLFTLAYILGIQKGMSYAKHPTN